MLSVLVLCGGRGSRLLPVTGGEKPKALVTVAGRAFIEHKLMSLRRAGLRDIILSIGIGGDQIRDHVGDGSALDVRVRYVDDGPRLRGTGGAVRAALPALPEAFWVTYGDSLVELDLAEVETAFRDSSQPALMTVLHNRDRWGPSNALVRGGSRRCLCQGPASARRRAHRLRHARCDQADLRVRTSGTSPSISRPCSAPWPPMVSSRRMRRPTASTRLGRPKGCEKPSCSWNGVESQRPAGAELPSQLVRRLVDPVGQMHAARAGWKALKRAERQPIQAANSVTN